MSLRPVGRVVAIAGASAAIGVVLSATHKIHYVRSSLHEPRRAMTAEAIAEAHAEFPALEDVSFETSDGLSLRGWFEPGPNRRAVILVHGGGGNRLELLPDARVLARHGYGFLVYDSRACGESQGNLSSWGDLEQRDVRAAVDYVAARADVDPDKIAALGFSIGGSTVAIEAADDPRVRAVILYATWTSLDDEMKDKTGALGPLTWGPAIAYLRLSGVNPDNVRPIDRIVDVHPRPLLMIAGGRDHDTPLAVMKKIFAAAREPKTLWVDEAAPHGSHAAAAPLEFEAHIIPFLSASLSSPLTVAAPGAAKSK